MVSLARSNLINDWRRTLAVVSILALLGTLILVQIGLPMHMIQSFMRPYTDANADLFAVGKEGRFSARPLSERHEGYLWMHDNIDLVEKSTSNAFGSLFIDENTSIRISGTVVNPTKGSLTYPVRLGEKIRKTITVPGNIVLTIATQQNYDLSIGDRATMNGHTVVIAGFVADLGEVFSQKGALMSAQTSRMLELRSLSNMGGGSYLLRLKDPSLLKQTQQQMQAYVEARGIYIRTPNEIINRAQNRFLTNQGAKQNIFIGIFALVIGIVVATQTMRGGVLAQLAEYGALRALGVGLPGIAKTIIEQAFWTGLLSIPVMIAFSFIIQSLAAQFAIGIAFPAIVLIACSSMVLFVAMVAGLLSLPVLYRVDPAELMR